MRENVIPNDSLKCLNGNIEKILFNDKTNLIQKRVEKMGFEHIKRYQLIHTLMERKKKNTLENTTNLIQ